MLFSHRLLILCGELLINANYKLQHAMRSTVPSVGGTFSNATDFFQEEGFNKTDNDATVWYSNNGTQGIFLNRHSFRPLKTRMHDGLSLLSHMIPYPFRFGFAELREKGHEPVKNPCCEEFTYRFLFKFPSHI
jgi:hypothetical protein